MKGLDNGRIRFALAQGTFSWQPIIFIGMFWRHAFIYRAGVPKRIGILERRWKCEKRTEGVIIVYKFGDDRCSNFGETFAHFFVIV